MSEDLLKTMHPAANILLDHLLRGVVEENERLSGEILRLEPARNLLGRLEVITKAGKVFASVSLDDAEIFQSCHHCDCRAATLKVDISGLDPLPLSDLYGASFKMAEHIVALLPEERLRFVYDEEDPSRRRMKIIVKGRDFIGGRVCSVSEDAEVAIAYAGGQCQIDAEQSQPFTFAPEFLQLHVTDALRGMIRAFGPSPMYDLDEPLECNTPHYAFLSDWLVASPKLSSHDEAVRSIVESLGGNESQMAVFRKNESLKNVHFRLQMAADLLGTIQISHPKGKIKLSLKDGELWEYSHGSYWSVLVGEGEERNTAALNDLRSVETVASGASLQTSRLNCQRSGMFLSLVYSGEARLVGIVDENTRGDLSDQEVTEMVVSVFAGETAFPPTSSIKFAYVMFPLEAVQGVLSVLGVEYEQGA